MPSAAPSGSSRERARSPRAHPQLAVRGAEGALVDHGARSAGAAGGPAAGHVLLPAPGPRAVAGREGRDGHRAEAGQPHPRQACRMAAPGLARRGWGDPHHHGAAALLAAGRAKAPAVLRPDRGRRDHHLPQRGPRGLPARDQRPARRAGRGGEGGGDPGVPPPCLQDGDGHGEDDGDGDDHRLEHPQQGGGPGRRALLGRGAGRLPQRDHPQPARRAQAPGGRGQPVPQPRPRAPTPHAAACARARAGHQLARLRAEERPGRRPVGEGAARRTPGPHPGDHPHRRRGRRRRAGRAT